jgi:C1A family cysteine protease
MISENDCEKYVRGFPPVMTSSYDLYHLVSTPLKTLKSPLKQFKKDEKIPDFFMYRPKYFSEVRNQGRCGSCWSFVICSMISDQITLKIVKFGKNLNVEQLLSCYPGSTPCDGEAPEDVLLWMESSQFKLSISSKYEEKPIECVKTEKGFSIKKQSVKSLCKYIQKESIKNPSEEENEIIKDNILSMKMQLYTCGPFFGSMRVYSDFFNFSGNKIYKKTIDEQIGGHAIVIVGWCDPDIDLREGFTDGYWICKNSWGTEWASEYDFPGYFAIKMGSNECGIESRSGSADVDLESLVEGDRLPEQLFYNNFGEYFKDILKNKAKDIN